MGIIYSTTTTYIASSVFFVPVIERKCRREGQTNRFSREETIMSVTIMTIKSERIYRHDGHTMVLHLIWELVILTHSMVAWMMVVVIVRSESFVRLCNRSVRDGCEARDNCEAMVDAKQGADC